MADKMEAKPKNEEPLQRDSLIPYLVADSGAFLKNIQLQEIAERIFTIREVVHEIKDAVTKQRLAVLPYTIEFREPSLESLQHVTKFSKKTGDYRSLSAVDLRVLALTYQLEKEFCSTEHIREEPLKKVQYVQNTPKGPGKKIAGFYVETKGLSKEIEVTEENNEITENCSGEDNKMFGDRLTNINQDQNTNKDKQNPNDGNNSEGIIASDEKSRTEISNDRLHKVKSENSNQDSAHEKMEVTECDDNEEFDDKEESDDTGDFEEEMKNNEDDDDEGWITPGNISKVKKDMGFKEDMEPVQSDMRTVCLTTDFAMQNVLIQMGLHVISVNGMLIRQARSYVLKCYGCYKETPQMDKIFCHACGNKTLTKVSITVADDGSIQYHYPKRRRPFNIRGTKFSLPLPKGGRHSNDRILCEDQRQSQRRLPKNKDTADALDPDYVGRASPFTSTDVTSRAFNLGLHVKQQSKQNPNEGRKKKSRRK